MQGSLYSHFFVPTEPIISHFFEYFLVYLRRAISKGLRLWAMADVYGRARNWCITFNNYTPEDYTRACQTKCRYIVVGRETGDNGTPHLQIYVEFDKPMTMRAAQAAVFATEEMPGRGCLAHMEHRRGSAFQLSYLPDGRKRLTVWPYTTVPDSP